MGVSTTTNRKDYVGTGTTGPFPYDFYIFEAADMEVWTTDASGIPVQLTSAEYTITGVGLATGGSVTTVAAVPVGYPLALVRVLSYTQPFSFTDLGDFFASQHEAAFDRVTMLLQQLAEITGRGITMPITFTESATVEGAPTIGYAVGVTSTGTLGFVPNMGADQTALLADQVSASNGAGRVGFTYALDYAAGTVGKAIKAIKDVMDAATTDAANLAADVANLATLNATNYKVPVRQTVLAGAVDAAGSASFLSVGTGLAVNLAATTVPVIIAFAAGFGALGEVDHIGRIAADTSIGSLTASSTLYLYVDRNVSTGALTYGFTNLAPNYGYGTTKSTVSGQHTYRIDEGMMYVGNGSGATAVQRVFLGECVTGASTVISVITYALMGRYDSGWTGTLPGTSTAVSKSANIGTSGASASLLLKCLSAESGWAVGDIVSDAITVNAAWGAPLSITRTGNNTLTFATSSASAFQAVRKDTGAPITLTAAKWAYKLVAKRAF